MRSNLTHRKMTMMANPWLNPRMVEMVNHKIDNPDPWATFVQSSLNNQFGRNAFNVPGLSKIGHRQVNHDFLSAALQGWSVAGPEGVRVAWNHVMQDTFSDTLVRSLGPEGRDLWESMFNYITAKPRYRRGMYPR